VPQTYDIRQSYRFNYDRGPLLDFAPVEVPVTPFKEFLGLKVRSRIGIAAGLLLNSKWISAYAKLGFDILTYKTVRSSARPCYPLPNWVFADDRGKSDGPVYATEFDPANPEDATSAVCFGMPSMAPNVWRADVRRAKHSLGEGQPRFNADSNPPSQSASTREYRPSGWRLRKKNRRALLRRFGYGLRLIQGSVLLAECRWLRNENRCSCFSTQPNASGLA